MSTDGKSEDERPTTLLRQTAYDALRTALRDGTIKPGDRIRERDIAERFGVGRTPAREALKRLELEGILTQSPDNGLIYQRLSQSEIIEIHTVSAVLVGLAARNAAQNATSPEADTMKLLLAQLERSLGDDVAVMLVHAHRLDQVIYTAARNQFLSSQLRQIGDRLGLQSTGKSTFSRPDRRAEFLADTQAMVAAICNRDSNAAEAAARLRSERGMLARLALDTPESEASSITSIY